MTISQRMPYPGLRPFARDESDLFFGREGCIDDMVDKLAATRFLAVLGSSGSGKSSIVRTGLFDALELGLNSALGSDWVIADLRPGGKPYENLARTLLDGHEDVGPTDISLTKTFLKRGPRSLVQWYRDGNVRRGSRLLVLVDQFEELFRYADYASREEAEAFVNLLLESSADPTTPIYVVITMRSEYLGACSLINGLAERINDGLYLTPRLTRDQCRQAIEGPARVAGFTLEAGLVNTILNDVTNFAPWEDEENVDQLQRISRRADQLPLLQHVLNRLWQQAAAKAAGGPIVLTAAEYNRVGGLKGALAAHGDEILSRLRTSGDELVAERIFRGLVVGAGALAVRNPCAVKTLVDLSGAEPISVKRVIDAFRAQDCNFLAPPLTEPLYDDTIVDISHESLIRQWAQLTQWTDAEDQARGQWLRLSYRADQQAKGLGALLTGMDLQNSLEWWQTVRPSYAWARRYGNNFEAIRNFLARSQAAHEQELAREAAIKTEQEEAGKLKTEMAQQRVRSRAMGAIIAVVLLALGVTGYAASKIIDQNKELSTKRDELVQAGKDLVANNNILTGAKKQLAYALENSKRDNALLKMVQQQLYQKEAEEHDILYSLLAYHGLEKQKNNELQLSARYALAGLHLSNNKNNQNLYYNLMAGSNYAAGPLIDSYSANFDDDGIRNFDRSSKGSYAIFAYNKRNFDVVGLRGNHNIRLESPNSRINNATFSPDESKVVGFGDGNDVLIWDIADKEQSSVAPVLKLHGHGASVRSAHYSADGHYILTTSGDKTARIWNLTTGASQVLSPFEAEKPRSDDSIDIHDAIFNADASQVLMTGTDRWIRIWDVKTGKILHRFPTPEANTKLQFSPDYRHLITIAGSVSRVWDMGNWDERDLPPNSIPLLGHKDSIRYAMYTSGGALVTLGDDHQALLWNARAGILLGRYNAHSEPVVGALESTSGKLVTVGQDGRVNEWNIGLGIYWDYWTTGSVTNQASISSDNKLMAMAFDNGKVTIVNREDGNEYLRFKGHQGAVYSAVFSPAGDKLVTTGGDGMAFVWSTLDGSNLLKMSNAAGTMAVFSPDGSQIAFAKSDRTVTVIDSVRGKLLQNLIGHLDIVNDVEYSPDGQYIITASNDGTAKIWKSANGRYIATLNGHADAVYSAEFSKDGTSIVTGGRDGRAVVWDAHTYKKRQEFRVPGVSVFSATFSPEANWIVTSNSDNTARIWDIATGKVITTLSHGGPVYWVRFTPLGRGILTTSGDRTVRTWNISALLEPRENLMKNTCSLLLEGNARKFSENEIAEDVVIQREWVDDYVKKHKTEDVCDGYEVQTADQPGISGLASLTPVNMTHFSPIMVARQSSFDLGLVPGGISHVILPGDDTHRARYNEIDPTTKSIHIKTPRTSVAVDKP